LFYLLSEKTEFNPSSEMKWPKSVLKTNYWGSVRCACYFSGAVEIFCGQRLLSTPVLARTPTRLRHQGLSGNVTFLIQGSFIWYAYKYFCIVWWNLKENWLFLKSPQKLRLYCFLLLVMLLFLGPVRHLRQLELIWFSHSTLILDDRLHCPCHEFVLGLRTALVVRSTVAWVTVILITTIHHMYGILVFSSRKFKSSTLVLYQTPPVI